MSIVFWILVILGIVFVIFYLSNKSKIKEGKSTAQNEAKRQVQEQIMRPEKKHHEEEKKRWEDEYWRRHAK